MALKGNQFKSNSFRNESSEPERIRRTTTAPKERFANLPTIDFQNGRFIKITGLFFVILSLYFLIAFTSYLFTWEDDYSYVIDANGGWGNLFKSVEELESANISPVVQNWLGKFGALLAHQFIYEWFGVASFLFAFVFFVIGYRLLFKVKIFPLEKTLGYSLYFLLFISLTLGFAHSLFSEAPHFVEGSFGFWTNRLLVAQVGRAGVGGLIAFLGLTILIIAYNIDFKIPARQRTPEPEFIPDDAGNTVHSGNALLREEAPLKPVEFNVNESLANGPKKEQNIVLTPSRFEEKEVMQENEIILPVRPVVNVMQSPPVAAVVPELEIDLPIVPELSIEKTEEERKSEDLVEQFGAYDPTLDLASY